MNRNWFGTPTPESLGTQLERVGEVEEAASKDGEPRSHRATTIAAGTMNARPAVMLGVKIFTAVGHGSVSI